MRTRILTLIVVLITTISCRQHVNPNLIGKWQKADDKNIVIEFSSEGEYRMYIHDETPSGKAVTAYAFNGKEAGENLTITDAGHSTQASVRFTKEDQIEISLVLGDKLSAPCKYTRL